jgi:hypothetical protein
MLDVGILSDTQKLRKIAKKCMLFLGYVLPWGQMSLTTDLLRGGHNCLGHAVHKDQIFFQNMGFVGIKDVEFYIDFKI